jgi:hypothetical protein
LSFFVQKAKLVKITKLSFLLQNYIPKVWKEGDMIAKIRTLFDILIGFWRSK